MANKINISIPQPCQENWQEMKAEDKGRFCNSCQKKVFDFTSYSDREIINAFEKNNNLCGRFLNTQLDRDLIKPKEKSSLWLATTTALISLVGLNEATAQEKIPTEQTEGNILKGESIQVTNQEIEVSGVVIDGSDDRKFPLPGANVVVKGTDKSTQTDFDGKFLIKANVNDTLSISFVGMLDKKIRIKKSKQNIIILLENDNKIEKIVMGGYSKSEKHFKDFGLLPHKKRTFLGRIFHWIGNIFR